MTTTHLDQLGDFLTGEHGGRTLSEKTKKTKDLSRALIEFAQYLDWVDTYLPHPEPDESLYIMSDGKQVGQLRVTLEDRGLVKKQDSQSL